MIECLSGKSKIEKSYNCEAINLIQLRSLQGIKLENWGKKHLFGAKCINFCFKSFFVGFGDFERHFG